MGLGNTRLNGSDYLFLEQIRVVGGRWLRKMANQRADSRGKPDTGANFRCIGRRQYPADRCTGW